MSNGTLLSSLLPLYRDSFQTSGDGTSFYRQRSASPYQQTAKWASYQSVDSRELSRHGFTSAVYGKTC